MELLSNRTPIRELITEAKAERRNTIWEKQAAKPKEHVIFDNMIRLQSDMIEGLRRLLEIPVDEFETIKLLVLSGEMNPSQVADVLAVSEAFGNVIVSDWLDSPVEEGVSTYRTIRDAYLSGDIPEEEVIRQLCVQFQVPTDYPTWWPALLHDWSSEPSPASDTTR